MEESAKAQKAEFRGRNVSPLMWTDVIMQPVVQIFHIKLGQPLHRTLAKVGEGGKRRPVGSTRVCVFAHIKKGETRGTVPLRGLGRWAGRSAVGEPYMLVPQVEKCLKSKA